MDKDSIGKVMILEGQGVGTKVVNQKLEGEVRTIKSQRKDRQVEE